MDNKWKMNEIYTRIEGVDLFHGKQLKLQFNMVESIFRETIHSSVFWGFFHNRR